MAQFQYKARTSAGEMTTGTIAAPSINEASRMLRDGDKFVLDLQQTTQQSETAEENGQGGRIKREHIVTFTHELAVMIDTGVTITEALECSVDQTDNDRFRAVLRDVLQQVEAGESFSNALERHANVFPTVMISLVRASEASGTLGKMLDRVTTYMSKELRAVKKVRGAMIYPTIMVVTVIAVTVFLLSFVMPRLAEVYQAKGAALPMPTQIVMTASHAVTAYWYAWLIGAAGAGIVVYFAAKSEGGRRLLDYLKLKTPLIGPLFQKLYVNRSCRVMGMMIAAGLPILDIIDLVRRVSKNHYYEQLWDRVAARLETGGQVAEELFKTDLMPRFVAQMIHSGEKSGRLGQVLDRVAEVTEESFDEQVKTSTQLIEPVMIVVIGSIIGFMVLAMLLPIFSVSRVMGG
jgi:type IV pilus assembly protein PilC